MNNIYPKLSRPIFQISTRYEATINMHLNPTYVATGTAIETAFLNGTYNASRMIQFIHKKTLSTQVINYLSCLAD